MDDHTLDAAGTMCLVNAYAPPGSYEDLIGSDSIERLKIFPIDPPNAYLVQLDGTGEVLAVDNFGVRLKGLYWHGNDDASRGVCGDPENFEVIIDKAEQNPVPEVKVRIN